MSNQNKCPECGADMMNVSCPGGCFVTVAHEVGGADCQQRTEAAKADDDDSPTCPECGQERWSLTSRNGPMGWHCPTCADRLACKLYAANERAETAERERDNLATLLADALAHAPASYREPILAVLRKKVKETGQ
jgi:ribosomal protein L37AE/L43A